MKYFEISLLKSIVDIKMINTLEYELCDGLTRGKGSMELQIYVSMEWLKWKIDLKNFRV